MKGTLGQSSILILMVVVRILTMLVAFKFLSNHFGAAGFGLLSQVMAVASLFSTFAGGGLANGLVKEVAAAEGLIERAAWLKAGLAISFGSAVLLGLISFGLFLHGAKTILDDSKLSWVFVLIGFAQVFTGFGNTAQAFLSGIRDIKAVAWAGIIGAVFSVLLIIAGSYWFGLEGAVVGCAVLALSPSLFAMLFLSRKHTKELANLVRTQFSISQIQTLLHYSLAMIIAAAAVPLVLIFMRLSLSQTAGWEVVGHWQAVARIGDAYIQIFGALFMSIILPKLSAQNQKQSLQAMFRFMPPIIGLFMSGGLVFWLFSPQIIRLAYASNFDSSNAFVFPQLLADFFKIMASFFIYRFVAMGRPYIQALGEVIQAASMIVAFSFLLPNIGGLAAVWAYVIGAGVVFGFAIVATTVDGTYRAVA